jgi:hypothetical protein
VELTKLDVAASGHLVVKMPKTPGLVCDGAELCMLGMLNQSDRLASFVIFGEHRIGDGLMLEAHARQHPTTILAAIAHYRPRGRQSAPRSK